MKILRIIPSMDPKHGGPCQGIRNSIPALISIGIKNEVVCLDEPSADYLQKDNFKIHALGSPKNSWGYSAKLTEWVKLHSKEYDIIIIHGLWLYHSFSSVKAILKSRASNTSPRIYIMPHGMLDPWFQRDKTRRLKALRNEIYWRLLEKRVVNNADGLLFTCQQELLLARETFTGYKPQKELNVGYGIQAPPASTKSMQLEFFKRLPGLSGRPFLLFLSRIHPKKGIDLLIDIYIKLEAQNIKLPALVIAGPNEGEYAVAMQGSAKASDNIHFAGMLQGDAKWGAFYGCEAFVLPSHQENFGISVAEALACGKPVLISDQVNIWQEIKNGGAGIVESDTLDGVDKLLRSWATLNASDRTTMANNAYQVYDKHFAVEQAALRLKEVLLKEVQHA
jgi:glycosyltransferase involved in cell wall biosynthesis